MSNYFKNTGFPENTIRPCPHVKDRKRPTTHQNPPKIFKNKKAFQSGDNGTTVLLSAGKSLHFKIRPQTQKLEPPRFYFYFVLD